MPDPSESVPPNQPFPLGTFLRLFPSVAVSMFMAMLDQTIVASTLPTIAAAFAEADRISYVMVAYLVTVTIAAPVYGRLGDLLGRRRLLFAALAVLIAASLFCAASVSMEMLIVGRALQGMGAGGLMTMANGFLAEIIPPRERARFQGYIAATAMVANALGPVLGGFLTQHFGWPSIFLINIPLGVLATLLALRLPANAGTERFRFDYGGLMIFTVFILSLLLALEQIRNLDMSAIATAVGLLVLALFSFLLLVYRERRASTPLLPIQLFTNPTIWRANLMAATQGAAMISMLTFLPLYLAVARGASAGELGVLLLPLTIGGGIGSLVSGRIISRIGRTTAVSTISLLFTLLAILAIALFSDQMTASRITWVAGVFAGGLGTVAPVVTVTVQVAAERRMLGAAVASVLFSRTLGSSVGTALVGTILFAALAATGSDVAALFAKILSHGPSSVGSLSAAEHLLVQTEIAGAFSIAFFAVAAFVMIGLIMSMTIPLKRI
jgi:EmrB/QacA subfamily drug resistance transporter